MASSPTKSPAIATLRMFESTVKGKVASAGMKRGDLSLGFNPKEITWAKTAGWTSKPNKKPQPPEYGGPQPGTISFEAFLSQPRSKDVSAHLLKLFECVEPSEKTKKDNPRPPFVQLIWGGFQTGLAVVKSVSAKITLFDADGTPTRAVVSLQLQEVPLEPPGTNPTSGGPSGRRVHVVVTGDTLQSVAWNEYDDAARWRDIAAANGIDDPLRLRPGARLLLPLADDLPAWA